MKIKSAKKSNKAKVIGKLFSFNYPASILETLIKANYGK